jgi:hypothetical protein
LNAQKRLSDYQRELANSDKEVAAAEKKLAKSKEQLEKSLEQKHRLVDGIPFVSTLVEEHLWVLLQRLSEENF